MEILGHQIPLKLERLLYEVLDLYPDKQYVRIASYSCANGELGGDIKPENKALARPDVTECIAIWIQEGLSEQEFNATLAEELLHHMQAAEGMPGSVIFQGCDVNNQTHVSICRSAEKVLHEVISIVWDLDAHKRMQGISSSLFRTIRMSTAEGMTQALGTISGRIESVGSVVNNLAVYALWYWDLHVMGTKATRDTFKKLEEELFTHCSTQSVGLFVGLKTVLSDDHRLNLTNLSMPVLQLVRTNDGMSNTSITFINARATGNNLSFNNDNSLVTTIPRNSA